MVKYTITPWRSQHDLLRVRSQLYRTSPSSPTDHRRHAVDRVMAWKLRGNLPHAVESTALLIDAILHHDSSGNSIFSIRAVYSAAFTRFVTGFCDIGRNKERSLEPSSMLDIAKQIGMPVEFVALRHEATHEELPAVGRLVKATEDALHWLWTVYWSRLEEPETEEVVAASLDKIQADARQILRGFRSRRRNAVKTKKHRNDPTDIQSTASTCKAFFGTSSTKMYAFAGVLVDDGLLSPSKRELGASLDGAYVIWDELLKLVVREHKQFAAALIKALLEGISRPSEVRPDQDAKKEALCQWVLHVLHGDQWGGIMSTIEQRTLAKDTMMWFCTHPGYWTKQLGADVLELEDEDFVEDWQEIFSASQLGDAEQGDVLAERVAGHEVGKEPLVELSDDAELGNWIRAAAPFAAPIGMVR